MDVVATFLEARRDRQGLKAASLVHPNATIGSVWGYHQGVAKTRMFLRDEQDFLDRGYVDKLTPLTKIDDNTYMRTFVFDRHLNDYSGHWIVPKWREVYFVKDGRISFVHCSRQPNNIWDVFRIWRN